MKTPTFRITVLLLLGSALSACAGMKPAEAPTAATPVVAPTAAAPTAPAATPAQEDAEIAAASTEAVPAAATSVAGAPVTQAEDDFSAIYGTAAPDADDDGTGNGGASPSYDPWEKWNRKVHSFNNVIDRGVAKPVATVYVKVVPQPMRRGVTNFFNNLGQPVSAFNALLQGKPSQAWSSLARFLINTTVGIGGIFDPASHDKLPTYSEDLGQTFGVWGWRNSRYVELPLFGPRTVRDTFGLAGSIPLSITQGIEDDKVRFVLQGLQLTDMRARLMALDSLREGAVDDYAFIRDGWLQRRNFQIRNSRPQRGGQDEDGSTLPDYLLDDGSNPTVPIDAMPMIPTN